MLSAWLPNTSWNPPRIRASAEGGTESGWAAAGLERVPNAINKPDSTNVPASSASELRTPMKATATPPPTAPATWAPKKVVWITAVPST